MSQGACENPFETKNPFESNSPFVVKNPFKTESPLAPNNPFGSKSMYDEDVDDDVFLKTPSPNKLYSKNVDLDFMSMNPFRGEESTEEPPTILTKMEQIQLRTVESTKRSLAHLTETEETGGKIAKELEHQREQLENSSHKMDTVNANLRNSQKHLKRIKSIFGGLKDFLTGNRIKPVKSDDALSFNKSMSSLKTSKSKSKSVQLTEIAVKNPRNRASTLGASQRTSKSTNFQNRSYDEVIEDNLGQMLHQVTNLKHMAVDLGEELDSHNDIIEAIIDKHDEANESMEKQRKEIAKLL